MGMADEIEKLHNLRLKGAISEEEYQKAKEAILRESQSAGEKLRQSLNKLSSNVNTWSMLIHISQFFGYLIPLAGLIVPILLWQLKKEESEIIDTHGRIVVNWIITVFILGSVLVLLSITIIGIPLLLVPIVVCAVFPIVGAVKAYNGEVWPYPCSLRFFRVER